MLVKAACWEGSGAVERFAGWGERRGGGDARRLGWWLEGLWLSRESRRRRFGVGEGDALLVRFGKGESCGERRGRRIGDVLRGAWWVCCLTRSLRGLLERYLFLRWSDLESFLRPLPFLSPN